MEQVQQLWSGYGHILRYEVAGTDHHSVIVKHIHPPMRGKHPRGWNTSVSHQRKLTSYEVELHWYQQWSHQLGADARIPACLAAEETEEDSLLILEDLDAAGFPVRKSRVNLQEIKACLSWLARFHAKWMGASPDGLWEEGTYWHLATRPDELEAIEDKRLQQAAEPIARKLQEARYLTIVHGDAKLANFCFSKSGLEVAAVDFQYTGGGCGMKDVAYFVGSCLDEDECERHESALLKHYFTELTAALTDSAFEGDPRLVEAEWRALYPVAWADFFRFLQGWSPGHWKINSYSQRITRQVIHSLTETP